MKYTLRYNLADEEPVEVTTSLKDIVAWERRYKNKASNLANGIGFEDLLFLAWEASKTAGVIVPAVLDKFIEKVQNLDVILEEQPNPTGAAPTDED
jgi:predicted secreted protein